MQKAGLEAEIARLERLRAAHIDDQHAIRRQIRDAEREIDLSTLRIGEIGAGHRPARANGRRRLHDDRRRTSLYAERKPAGRALMQEV